MTTAYPGLTFKVEDGTGFVDSNSYTTTDYADAYHNLYGHTDWTGITDVTTKEEALMQATNAIDIMYGQEYYSIPRAQGLQNYYPGSGPYIQALLFPRFVFVINQIQVIQTGVIPVQLQKAVCEVALMYINGGETAIYPQPNLLKFTKNKSVKVGGITTSTTFGKEIDAERYPGFWKIDKILYPLLKKTNNPQYMSL